MAVDDDHPLWPAMQVGAIYRNHGSGRDSSLEVRYWPQGSSCLTHLAAPIDSVSLVLLKPLRGESQ